ncbi:MULTISPECIES: flagellar hook-length control protein FliK [unclassified Pseudomonas]|uniref:flagellar hook-length control protein FliK n=1 Tax=unclassified Pseudomonas TaxID=196821 RepID=UPI0037F92961
MDSDTQAFGAALQQAQTREAVPEPAPPVATAEPMPSTRTASLAATPENAAIVLQSGPAATAVEAAIEPPQAEVQAPPEAAVDDKAHVDEGEVDPLDINVPVAATQVSKEETDAADDDTQQPDDALEAIRQRLDLIDTAGQLAAGVLAAQPAVAWAQAPVLNAQPASGVDPEASALQWLETTPDGVSLEAEPAMDTPAEFAKATEALAQGAGNVIVDGQAPPAVALSPTAPFTLATLTPALAQGTANTGAEGVTTAITATVGSDTWQADLGQQVLGMVRRGEQQVDLQLHPADLGPLSISLNVSESGIQAQFHSAHASVRAAVEQALPQLQGALAAQGLSLGETSVNDGASRQAAGEQPRRESPGSSGEARRQQLAQASAPTPVVQAVSVGGGVDLYL